jgi:hypothetical protein
VVRTACIFLLSLGLAACNRGNQNSEAVRQAVLDHLAGRNLNIASMDINVTAVKFDGDKADATVTFVPKGGNVAQGMTIRYAMQQKGGKWEVVGTADSGHAGSTNPGTPNPHDASGGGAPGGNPHGAMPSPEDLPPVGKK